MQTEETSKPRPPRMPRGEPYTCASCEETHAPSLPPLMPDGVTPRSWQECETPAQRAAYDAHHHYRDHRTYDARGERGQALRRLREWVKPGDKLFTILRRRSSSGMCRHISIMKPDTTRAGEMMDLTWNAGKVLDWRVDRDTGGLVVGGCGMDMGFHAVYSLSRMLYPKGYDCTGADCPGNDHVNARGSNCAICAKELPKCAACGGSGEPPTDNPDGYGRCSACLGSGHQKPHFTRKTAGKRGYRYAVCSRKCQRATWRHRDGGYALRQGWL